MIWSNQVVFITGASSGIGRALALELGARGAALGLLARRAETLCELVGEIEARGGRAIALAGDVTNQEELKDAAAQLLETFGRVDVLVANAGIGTNTDGKNLNADDVAKVFNTNVLGAVNAVAAVTPQMIARGRGQLVVISSLAAYRGLPKSGAYCASKAAVSAFFESLRLDLTGTGVDVTIIHPGFIKTPLTAGRENEMPYLMELDDATEKIIRAIEARKKTYSFPWQLATITRAAMLFPISLYDRIVLRNSFRE